MEPDSTVRDGHKNKSGRKWLKRFIKAIVCLILIMVLAILAVLLLYAVNLHHKPDLNELLTRLKLAKFPETIKDLQVETRPVLDNDPGEPEYRNLFIRFQAEPDDIDNFIKSSSGIEKNHFRPLRPMPNSDEAPTWWPTDDSSGRMYFLKRYEREYISGIVAVYDDSNTVRICAHYMVYTRLRNMLEDIEDMRDAFEDFIDDMLHEVLDLFGY